MYKHIIDTNKDWIDKTWEKLDKKLSKVTLRSKDKLPYCADEKEHYDMKNDNIFCWTNGFWGGLNMLMYIGTGKKLYMETAKTSELLLDKCFENIKDMHHDVGFMWHILSGLLYKTTKDEKSFNRNYNMATVLMSRFNSSGNYIRAWNLEEAKTWSIIDCLMNLSILYWASEQIDDDRFKQIAIKHADMALNQHVRKDGTINHIVVHDEKTGEFVTNLKGQGYSETSCWSRGSAWAIYGFMISYVHTKEQRYLDAAKKVANYFIKSIEKTDYLPLTDFIAPAEPVYYDSTAGVCAACGMIEISKYCENEEQEYYLTSAIKMLKSIEKKWCDWTEDNDGILQNGMEVYGSKARNLIYGDFFFTEAILKLRDKDLFVW